MNTVSGIQMAALKLLVIARNIYSITTKLLKLGMKRRKTLQKGGFLKMARTIAEVLAELQKKTQEMQNQSLAGKSDGLEEKKYLCPKCKDQTGYIEKHDGVDVWVRCGCVEWRKAQKLMKASEITDEFQNMGFKNFNVDGKPSVIRDIRDCAMTYLKEFESIRHERANSIALLGQPGVGKTHLLTAVSNNLINKFGVPVLYFPYVEGFNDLKDDF